MGAIVAPIRYLQVALARLTPRIQAWMGARASPGPISLCGEVAEPSKAAVLETARELGEIPQCFKLLAKPTDSGWIEQP